ncbi:MAG: hypothetical protein E4H26_07895 [Flavobacteriales bacterium]|nr:MAG: hypothetical protein E4H26_07895 [Flavobacteriales bacterium]
MKTLNIIGAAILFLILSSCGSAMKYTWTKEGYTGKHFEKILVIGASKNMESRSVFENTVVKLLAEEGITAENSLKAIPPIQDITQISEEKIVDAVKAGNYDGVIVATLIDVNTKDVMESGTPMYGPMYGGRGYYGYGYGRYVYSGYNYMYTPDYYRQQQTYVVESRLFDTHAESADKALIWSGQSNITDPSSFESGAASFAKTLVKSLLKSKLIE